MTLAEGDSEGQAGIAAFLQRMLQLGWIDGHNLRIDTFWSADNDEKMRRNGAEAVARAPDVILAMGASVGPLLQVSDAVPIVFMDVPDPVGAGYVHSLARPGGNATGCLAFEYGIGRKWLELLKQIAPAVMQVNAVHDPAISAEILFGGLQSAASPFRAEISSVNFRDDFELERALTVFAATPNSGLIVASSSAIKHRGLIIALANRHKLPAVYLHPIFVADGGLISYGPDFTDQFRHAAGYVNRILRGEKPADLSVQAPTKYNLVINLKTFRAFGFTVPPLILARAEVIE
jgi:putative ABC transport system substrate-binding protein